MLRNLRMLLKLRTWLKSKTLTVSGILAAFLAIDFASPGDMLLTVVEFLANGLGVMAGTVLLILGLIRELVAALLRAKTERSLEERATE